MDSGNLENRIVYARDWGVEGEQIILVKDFVAVNFKELALSDFVSRFGGYEIKGLTVGGGEDEEKCQDNSFCQRRLFSCCFHFDFSLNSGEKSCKVKSNKCYR